jgi:hypothetical protein
MLEIFNELVHIYKDTFSTLPFEQQFILGFWGLCVTLFTISYLHLVFLIVRYEVRKIVFPKRVHRL